jgi:hypothetical protein
MNKFNTPNNEIKDQFKTVEALATLNYSPQQSTTELMELINIKR